MERKVLGTVLPLFMVLALFWGGCGGGGGGTNLVEVCLVEYDHWEKTELPDPDMSNLEGTYTLYSFDIDVWLDGVYTGMPISSGDFSSFSGTLVLTSNTLTESVTLEGESATTTGTYTVSASSSVAGTLHVTLPEGVTDVICAMGSVQIGDTVHYFMTFQSEMVCEMVAEDELLEPSFQGIGH